MDADRVDGVVGEAMSSGDTDSSAPDAAGAVSGVMDRLKAATAEQHGDAERRRLQRHLAAGRIAPGLYARWLGQMYLLHYALRREIERSVPGTRLLSDIVRDDGRHVANLRADLMALGSGPETVAPLTATARALTALSRASRLRPHALLGYNYVLEGSMNGNRFIARAMSRALALPALAYLDPYGEDQQAVWEAYRQRMDAATLDAAQVDDIAGAARDMFRFVSDMGDELVAEGERTVVGHRIG